MSGPAVVMLHGMLGSHRYWDAVVPKLAAAHRIILIDLLAFGKSPKPSADYTIEQRVTKIENVMQLEKDDKARDIIVGHSRGAFLALNFAIAYPQQVEKLILINPSMRTDEESLRKAIAEAAGQHTYESYVGSFEKFC